MDLTEIKKLASKAKGETRKYLTKSNLGKDETVQMLSCAYASLYLWACSVRSHLNLARAHWLIRRVCCVMESSDQAKHHSKLCQFYTDKVDDKKDFNVVYVIESQARVAVLMKETQKALKLKTKAQKLATEVQDSQDREIIESEQENTNKRQPG